MVGLDTNGWLLMADWRWREPSLLQAATRWLRFLGAVSGCDPAMGWWIDDVDSREPPLPRDPEAFIRLIQTHPEEEDYPGELRFSLNVVNGPSALPIRLLLGMSCAVGPPNATDTAGSGLQMTVDPLRNSSGDYAIALLVECIVRHMCALLDPDWVMAAPRWLYRQGSWSEAYQGRVHGKVGWFTYFAWPEPVFPVPFTRFSHVTRIARGGLITITDEVDPLTALRAWQEYVDGHGISRHDQPLRVRQD